MLSAFSSITFCFPLWRVASAAQSAHRCHQNGCLPPISFFLCMYAHNGTLICMLTMIPAEILPTGLMATLLPRNHLAQNVIWLWCYQTLAHIPVVNLPKWVFMKDIWQPRFLTLNERRRLPVESVKAVHFKAAKLSEEKKIHLWYKCSEKSCWWLSNYLSLLFADTAGKVKPSAKKKHNSWILTPKILLPVLYKIQVWFNLWEMTWNIRNLFKECTNDCRPLKELHWKAGPLAETGRTSVRQKLCPS